MKRTVSIIAALVLGACVSGATAAMEQPALELVKGTTDKVVEALRTERDSFKSDPDKLYALVDELIIPHFDFTRMASRVLGKHWRRATDEQKTRFVDEFRQLLVRTYATALNEYKDGTIDVMPVRERDEKKEASVQMKIEQGGGAPIPITYELYQGETEWKIYDVSIDGVSIALNYRSSFNSEVRRNGLDGLIARLSEKNQSP